MKVTFQTPLRDPQTHKILSPGGNGRQESHSALDDPFRLERARPGEEKENPQFTEGVDVQTTNGILQKPVIDADLPPGNKSLAPEPGGSCKPSITLSTNMAPGQPEKQGVSSRPSLGSPKQASQEDTAPYSLDIVTQSSCDTLTGSSKMVEDDSAPCYLDTVTHSSCDTLANSAKTVEEDTAPYSLDTVIQSTCDTLTSHAERAPWNEGEDPSRDSQADLPRLPTPLPGTGPQGVCEESLAQAKESVSEHPSDSPVKVGSPLTEESSGQVAGIGSSGPVRLEFSFSEASTHKRVPSPRSLGKRPGLKTPPEIPEARQDKAPEKAPSPAPLTRGYYTLDWDKMDDPSFDPFVGGRKSQLLGPPQSSPTQPMCAAAVEDTAVVETREEAADKEVLASLGPSSPAPPPPAPAAEPAAAPQQDPILASDMGEEHFWNPAEVLGTRAEVDYLEQFGTSLFKESALRKQSLYLKFDPLLNDSPQRPGPAPTDTTSSQAMTVPASGSPAGLKLVDLDLLGGPDVPVLEPGGPLPPPRPIVDILQYSQRDLDAAVEAAQKENLQLQGRCKELQTQVLEMGSIMDWFESTMYQVMEDAQKQKDLAKTETQKLLKEKEQLVKDLSSLENSFSDLFKRFEKQREAIEGYRTNEDSLKKCVEDSMARIEKEAQKYQALKTQAEEKLQLANEEIALVRSKASAEASALQASLRKEQMHTHSLEKALEQKTKENEELTRLCDDLISKMEKI